MRIPFLHDWMEARDARRRARTLPRAATLLPVDGAATPHPASVGLLSFSPDGSTVISASRDRPSLRVWRATDGRAIGSVDAPTDAGRLVEMRVTADGRRCVTTHAGDPWTLHVWDLEEGTCLAPVSGQPAEHLAHLALDPRGTRAIVLGYAQPLMDPDYKQWRITVVDLRDPGRARDFLAMEETYSVGSVAVHPDGVRAFVGTNGTVEVWDLDTGRCVATLAGCSGSPELVLDASGARCVVGMREGRVRIWDTASGEQRADLDVGSPYALVHLLPGEERCLVIGHRGPPRVWDLARGVPLQAIGEASVSRDRFAVDRSGSLMVIHDRDRTLDVWDLVCGEQLARVRLDERPGAFAIARDAAGVARVAIAAGRRARLIELV